MQIFVIHDVEITRRVRGMWVLVESHRFPPPALRINDHLLSSYKLASLLAILILSSDENAYAGLINYICKSKPLAIAGFEGRLTVSDLL